jgi:hypothetical protein
MTPRLKRSASRQPQYSTPHLSSSLPISTKSTTKSRTYGVRYTQAPPIGRSNLDGLGSAITKMPFWVCCPRTLQATSTLLRTFKNRSSKMKSAFELSIKFRRIIALRVSSKTGFCISRYVSYCTRLHCRLQLLTTLGRPRLKIGEVTSAT